MAEIISNKTAGRTRRSTRVDLTPMVDLGFLLITFFVFTTTMSQAKAMPILQAPDGEPIKVSESGAMTLLLGAEDKLIYYFGKFEDAKIRNGLIASDWRSIRLAIFKKKKNTSIDKLMFIIKSSPDSKFGNAINMLDEMAIADIPAGHYAEAEISPEEVAIL